MADNKKYYYLKLKEDFFESDEAVVLESMPDGYIYSNILLKLYLRSLKNNGLLMFNNLIPYNSQMLATITRHQVGTIEKAVKIFKDLQLIDVLDNGAIYMTNIQNFVGKSSSDADRKRAERSKNKAIGQMSGHLTEISPPEIEIDIDKDIEIESDISNHILSINNKQEIYKYFENKTGRLVTPLQTEKFENELARLVPSLELVKKAIDETVATHDSKKYNLAYLTGILRNWGSRGWTTPEMVENAKREYEESKKPSKEKPSAEFLEAMDLWKD
ncbi:phage replisome organizer N-terminal domain-containing protein [Streptococcus suis]|uniref:phage replisome organizer N-terminal domain-containing protein n=1 Tax=Streptococcus suis TaxID=1307 RepID=UPI002A77C8BC|nr:phage replisome organizer N-terminal domain-containing protein [Streptococcus suis]